jgi:hypothetical protein
MAPACALSVPRGRQRGTAAFLPRRMLSSFDNRASSAIALSIIMRDRTPPASVFNFSSLPFGNSSRLFYFRSSTSKSSVKIDLAKTFPARLSTSHHLRLSFDIHFSPRFVT